jgi:hypothetical protein
MATSGTRAWSLDIDEIIKEAVELAGGQQALGNDARTLVRSLNLLYTDLTNRKINLFTLAAKTMALSANDAEYAVSASDVDILNAAIRTGSGTSQTDIRIERVGFDLYAQISNKAQTGRPTLFYVDRAVANPTITLWPVPDQAYTLYYWVFQRFEDATAMAQDPGVPFRYIPVLTNGLAYQLARKRASQVRDPNEMQAAEALVARLKLEYEEALDYATTEDRERVSTFVLPALTTP